MTHSSREPRTFASRCWAGGSALMLVGVVFGAFGTHLLEGRLAAAQFSHYQTAVLYHLLHGLGLLLVGLIAQVRGETRALRLVAGLMLGGVVCFSGSIYLITAGAPRAIAAAAPVGGMAFMAAWGLLAWYARGQLFSRPGAT
ncbi:MAG TPA: DUF423 domain-containing protein [Steroidobacteraceae bacterium]|nr:DUF423 domain-containing protein [Steroidobacteraceae bacterium]